MMNKSCDISLSCRWNYAVIWYSCNNKNKKKERNTFSWRRNGNWQKQKQEWDKTRRLSVVVFVGVVEVVVFVPPGDEVNGNIFTKAIRSSPLLGLFSIATSTCLSKLVGALQTYKRRKCLPYNLRLTWNFALATATTTANNATATNTTRWLYNKWSCGARLTNNLGSNIVSLLQFRFPFLQKTKRHKLKAVHWNWLVFVSAGQLDRANGGF